MKTFIFGASGFAKEVEWLIYERNKHAKEPTIVHNFIVADTDYVENQRINGIAVISEAVYFHQFHKTEKHNCIIAVGSSVIREKIIAKISSDNTLFPNLIHPSVCYDERFTTFGQGNIICSGVIITTNIAINNFVHINLDVTIGHDSSIGNFTTISPGVHVSGNVNMECNIFIGTGATILENVSIAENAIIGASTLVNKSIVESGTYVGIPAKKIK
jgi:sugar O-acyltransferase (sialic acid O-acetyltransferase NeuD family)